MSPCDVIRWDEEWGGENGMEWRVIRRVKRWELVLSTINGETVEKECGDNKDKKKGKGWDERREKEKEGSERERSEGGIKRPRSSCRLGLIPLCSCSSLCFFSSLHCPFALSLPPSPPPCLPAPDDEY